MTDGHTLDSLAEFVRRARQRYWPSGDWPSGDWPSASLWPTDERQPLSALRPYGLAGPPPVEQAPDPAVEAAWEQAQRMFGEGMVVSGIVTGWNRGGLLIRWNDLQGFVPISQLRDVPLLRDDDSRDEALARWVGEELDLRVIELDKSRNRLVFSERATIWGPRDGERVLEEIAPGQVIEGCVSNLCDFGAFVDLGGIDGLVHISELSWGRVNHPREMLRIGQKVEVYVLGVDRENKRIALSLKRLRANPWVEIAAKYHIGQVTEATITNIVDFGAFAQIEEGIEGLIHVSELCEDTVSHPNQVVSIGQRAQVRILRIDSEKHRLGLSMRPSMGAEEAHPPQGQ